MEPNWGKKLFWLIGQSAVTAVILVLPPISSRHLAPTPLLPLAGFLGLLGGWLAYRGLRTLGKESSPFPYPNPEVPLQTTGVYGWIRHPIYASQIYAGAGWALLWWNWDGFWAWLVLTFWLWNKARVEERYLRLQYPEYEAYAQRVGQFFPKLRTFWKKSSS